MSLDVNISEPDEFNCIELHDCLKQVAEIKQIKDFTYHVDIVCGKGDNFIANVFRVSLKDTECEKNESIIVKTLINTIRQDLFSELHKREVSAYKYIINTFNLLQNNLLVEDRIILPKILFSCVDKNKEVIIFEDLLLNGFEVNNKLVKYDKLDFPHVSFIITELAKFHALSFVYQEKDTEFDIVKNKFNDLIFNENFLNKTKLKKYFFESFQMSLDVIKNEEIKKKLENIKPFVLEILRQYTAPKKYNVFCHGDCWINNILFKEEDNKNEICFLDFQAMRYASPVTDILYFIYICTDSEFRSEHFEELKINYYDTLKSFLETFEIDVNSVYPRSDFENDIIEMLPFGLIIALIELRIISTTPEANSSEDSEIELSENSQVVQKVQESKVFQDLVNDVVNECTLNGILNQLLEQIKN